MSNQLDYEINKELGECYLFMGDFDKAEEYYRKAANSSTQSDAPYLGLATVAVQRAELDKALVLYQKAASVEETDKALCGIGLIHMEQGQHQEAVDNFARALNKDVYKRQVRWPLKAQWPKPAPASGAWPDFDR